MGAAELDLRSAAGAAPLTRDVVVVSGPDAVVFLQGQLSQDVAGLAVGESAPTLLLQPTGKVDAWLRATRTAEDTVVLDVDEGWGEAVRARLKRFLLRTAATLEPATWTGVAVRGAGAADAAPEAPDGGVRAAAGWPGVEGVDVLGPSGTITDLPAATAQVLHGLRVEAGVPAMGAEVREGTIPAELGQWLIDASVSFTKGCYTGQELVARIDSRGGNVPRPVRALVVDGAAPAPGSEVRVDGASVGTVTSSAVVDGIGAVALATVARTVPLGGAVDVVDGSVTATAVVRELPLR